MKRYDVIVVGAGVIGLAVSYFAAQSGLSVLTLEAGDVAQGTSSHCDGGVLLSDKAPGFDSDLARRSRDLMAQLAATLPRDLEYTPTGSLLLFEDDLEAATGAAWAKDRAEFHLRDRAELQEHVKGLSDDIAHGLWIDGDAVVNPIELALGLAAGARQLGAKIRTHQPVAALIQSGQRIVGVQTGAGSFYAKTVVIAAGVYTPALCQTAGFEVPIAPRKGQILVTSVGTRLAEQMTLEFGYMLSKFGGTRRVDAATEAAGVALVLEPTRHGNLLIGSSRSFSGFETTCDSLVNRLIARRAARFFPALASRLVLRSYAGLRPYTKDHLPIVGWLCDGLIVASGHEGDGISLSPVTGELVAKALIDEDAALPAALAPARPGLTGADVLG